ncbi:hypothetical protein ANN_09907 [Periplaneta americana]|uniref:Uncharacterized protein n=1 Tax=Periplaneta americana TaxID=6978 RepID=A0ABQ8TML6_PERAM|nr:hypothetical protein ANN_09907 [Periplaneta americana]
MEEYTRAEYADLISNTDEPMGIVDKLTDCIGASTYVGDIRPISSFHDCSKGLTEDFGHQLLLDGPMAVLCEDGNEPPGFLKALRIPELGITEVEPILIDEISIALGTGPDGYRATFTDIEAYGVSNMTVVGVRSDLDTLQFQLSFYIPKIMVRARYKSSGVLIMIKPTYKAGKTGRIQ